MSRRAHLPAPGQRRAPLALALHLALVTGTLGLATPVSAQQAAPQAVTQRYEIPSGALGEVLAHFAKASGVRVAPAPELVQGRRSPGLDGSYAHDDALTALLSGTGLEAVRQANRSYALRQAAAPAAPIVALPLVSVKAEAQPGTRTLDTTTLRMLPAPNNDVLSALRLAPSVRFANNRSSALTQGELAPPEISIHGAKPYQNLFLLDGLSLNNDLDPVSRTATSITDVPGNPLGMPVDKELICDLQLMDSNVGAEYGNFQGGVVKADLCEARAAFAGRITMKVARSDWQKLHVDPAQATAVEQSTSAALQGRWNKQFWTAQLEGKPSADLGIVAQASFARSEIPLRGYAASMTPNDATLGDKEQRRMQRDALVKLTWHPDADTSAWFSVREQPLSDRYFIVNSRHSNFDVEGGGRAITAGTQHSLGGWTLRHDISHNDVTQSRRTDTDHLRAWSWSADDKNWGDGTRGSSSQSIEGSWGDIDSRQRTAAYKFKISRNAPLAALGAEHRFSAGLELSHRDAHYARPTDLMSYIAGNRLPTSTCTSPPGVVDTETCSLAPSTQYPTSGQFWRTRTVYRAGSFDVQAGQYALWLQDSMRWGGLTVRAGLRLDRDELSAQGVIAPRLAATWALDAQRKTEAGLNRYYGRSLFGYAVREKIAAMQVTEQRNTTDWIWKQTAQSLATNRLKDLGVPYDDEFKLGVQHHFDAGLKAGLSWVHRKSRDEITRVREANTVSGYANLVYRYTNNGRSSNDTLALELRTTRPLAALAGRHYWSVSADVSEKRSNHTTFDDSLSEADANRLIVYKGEVIRYSDRPAEDFNAPWALSTSLQSEFPATCLSLFQTLRWQGGYRSIAATKKTEMHDAQALIVHEQISFPNTFSWDLSLRWEPMIGAHRPFVQVGLNNITNRRNVVSVSTTGIITYESGRAVTLQLGYDF